MDRIVWQPVFGHKYDFSVNLDNLFAKEMIDARVPSERQIRMNQLANEELKRLGENWLNPFHFYENSCFVSQFYIGKNGVWLATDILIQNKELEKPIDYHSHNVDSSKDLYVLLKLFDTWVKYADALKNF